MTNAIEVIAIYETKIRVAHYSIIRVVQEANVARNAKNKRKWEGGYQNNTGQQNKRQKVIKAYTAGPNNQNGYVENLPFHNNSKLHHIGLCTLKCVQPDEPTHSGTAIVEVPKELPKVSMVNSCLKKLKFHLARFDIVVKERTTATTITEGTWGFEHTKACFRDDIIPFVKNLKDLFTSFDQYLIDEVTEVQKSFKQMEMAVEQNCAVKSEFQGKMEMVLKENDLLLKHALSVDIVNIVVNNCMNVNCLTMDACEQCVTTKSELKTNFIEKENYKMLLKQYNILEKHCISLELNNQLNTELFQRDNMSPSDSGPNFADLFKINDLKAQTQEKDTVILKLKEKIKSLRADDKESKVEDVETQNLELDHRVTKLTAENNHLKQTYKQLFDSIKSSRVQSKEQCDDLIHQVNLKSIEVADLNASLQERVLVDAIPLVPKLRKNRTAHIDYLKYTLKEAATLRELVESERLLSPLNTPLVRSLLQE
nr:reverse transcriptase domain-containing protein [Tanacetum cinerariifolium]